MCLYLHFLGFDHYITVHVWIHWGKFINTGLHFGVDLITAMLIDYHISSSLKPAQNVPAAFFNPDLTKDRHVSVFIPRPYHVFQKCLNQQCYCWLNIGFPVFQMMPYSCVLVGWKAVQIRVSVHCFGSQPQGCSAPKHSEFVEVLCLQNSFLYIIIF